MRGYRNALTFSHSDSLSAHRIGRLRPPAQKRFEVRTFPPKGNSRVTRPAVGQCVADRLMRATEVVDTPDRLLEFESIGSNAVHNQLHISLTPRV